MPRARSTARVPVRIHPLGDTALLADLGSRLDTGAQHEGDRACRGAEERGATYHAGRGCAGTVTVQYDPDRSRSTRGTAIRRLAQSPPMEGRAQLHRVPVVYDGPWRPPRGAWASAPRRIDRVARRSRSTAFPCRFVPGWAYMGRCRTELVIPRRTGSTHVPRVGRHRGTGDRDLSAREPRRLAPDQGGLRSAFFLPDSDPPSLFRAPATASSSSRSRGDRSASGRWPAYLPTIRTSAVLT
jgi:hypothetical protein